jgi:hypothetical protein
MMTHLLVLVVDDVEKFPELLQAWEDIGVPGVTIVESRGSRRLGDSLRDDLPLIVSLRALLETERPHNFTVFTVMCEPTAL